MPLEEKINALLKDNSERDAIVSSATKFEGKYPWTDEDDEIVGLREQGETMSSDEQDNASLSAH